MPFPVRGDDRDLVVRRVERDTWRADVVDDDGVEALALELVARVLDRAFARLGGEADQQLAGAALGRARGQDVLGLLELEASVSPASAFLILSSRGSAGR